MDIRNVIYLGEYLFRNKKQHTLHRPIKTQQVAQPQPAVTLFGWLFWLVKSNVIWGYANKYLYMTTLIYWLAGSFMGQFYDPPKWPNVIPLRPFFFSFLNHVTDLFGNIVKHCGCHSSVAFCLLPAVRDIHNLSDGHVPRLLVFFNGIVTRTPAVYASL